MVFTSFLKKCAVYFLVTLMLFQSFGCKYFQYDRVTSDFETSITSIGEIHKYFIIHDKENLYELTDITADETKMSGNLALINNEVFYTEGRNNRFKKEENSILHEVHIYLNDNADSLQLGYGDIPMTDLKEMKIIEMDTGTTVASYVFSTIGIIAGILGIILIIALLTKSSCPYIYVNNGDAFIFEGETYGGAIAQNLERDDYMPLPSIKPLNGTYQLRISNELKERQYTNLAELLVVNHEPLQKVLLDKYGKAHLIESAQVPTQAHAYNGQSLLPALEEKDKKVFMFNEEEYSKNGIIMKFEKPDDATNGNLLLKGKNTLWFDFLFGEFISKFGSSYDAYMDKQKEMPGSERLQKMLDSDFPLSIYMKENGEWKMIDYLFTVGPLATREFVIPVDLSAHTGDAIEIKVETGFMFWELDYAAMDFTENTELDINYVKPFKAEGTGAQDWLTALEKTDENYMAQEKVGDVTQLIFKAPSTKKGQQQTVFLHTRGYYELIREFEGMPNIVELNQFKTPGHFSDFSRSSYLKVLDKENAVASKAVAQ